MNGVLAVALAILIYPGIVVALIAAWVLAWVRDAARAAVGGGHQTSPLSALTDVRDALTRDTLIPPGGSSLAVAIGAALGLAMPIAALVLLPVPGNPLVRSLGLTGDLAVEGALVLGLPLARLLMGWAVPSPFSRLAADRGARQLAGYALPAILALMTIAQQTVTLKVSAAGAPISGATPLLTILSLPFKPEALPLLLALLARLLAAAAFACCLPALAQATALREYPGGVDSVAGELTDLSGFDLAIFRVAEGLQLVAVAALFVAAFVLPLAAKAAASSSVIQALWPIGLLLTAAGIGGWEALRVHRSDQDDKPPLSWWFGFPLLLALFALVLAAWAARSA